jgi:hypothetical protein
VNNDADYAIVLTMAPQFDASRPSVDELALLAALMPELLAELDVATDKTEE